LNLFQQIPVRRQTAIKNSKKTLLKIKKMVQAYAMARPSIRLSFKVLKAKNESLNWMYAPGENGTLTEAALRVGGTGIAPNCILKNWPTPSKDGNASPEDLGFRLVALLPKVGSGIHPFSLRKGTLANSNRYHQVQQSRSIHKCGQ
jgi:hypothetical protein